MPPPQRAKPAGRSARCGVGDDSPRTHPPHPQTVSSGPRPHARKDEWSGVGERPTPDAPQPDKRRPSRYQQAAPTARKASSQERALPGCRRVPTPAPPAPTAYGNWAPVARLKERVVRGGRVPDLGRPTPRQGAPPPSTLMPPPQRAMPARKSARCGVGDGSPRPYPPRPQPVGSGPRPHA